MNIDYSADEIAFRDEVRAFLKSNLPDDLRNKVLNTKRMVSEDFVRWQRILFERGWGGPYWTKEYGGTGWNETELSIFEQEYTDAGAPRTLDSGHRLIAPVLMKFGSPEQKAYFLPRILTGEDIWAQGYSEPGAGSDLASLKTKAERVGDKYLVNGQKTWTTIGHWANWIFCLVRTSNEGRPQQGISFLLIDMKSPGVTLRPIIMLDGEHEINEVFFDNVEVPVENLVGEENKGWTYAKYLLTHERIMTHLVGTAESLMRRLKRIARETIVGSRTLMEDPGFRERLAQCEMELMAHKMNLLRTLAAVAKTGSPGPESSLLKVRGTELTQQIHELIVNAIGPDALAYQPEAMDPGWQGEPIGSSDAITAAYEHFNMRKMSILGGSNEVQRNIIAHRILGL